MIGICLELMGECTACKAGVAINGLVERVLCSRCTRPFEMPWSAWKSLLEDVVSEGPTLELKEGRTQTQMSGRGTLNLMYGRMDPRCEGCKTEMSIAQAMEQARQTNGWVGCQKCGKWLAMRVPPNNVLAEIAPGVTCVFGEDPGQLSGGVSGQVPNAARAVAFPCPSCGAALDVDGSNRMVACRYCQKTAYLPDDLWHRLHPAVTALRWYLLYDERAADAAMAQRPFEWRSLDDAIVDDQGQLYACGEAIGRGGSDDAFAVWAMGEDLRPRWVRKDLKFDDARLTFGVDGSLFLWSPKKHSMLKLSRADGSTIAKLGGKEQPGATMHGLDLRDANQLCVDIDGSILMIKFNRYLRYTPDGQPMTTWPAGTGMFARKEKLGPLYKPDPSNPDSPDRIQADYDSEKMLQDRPLTGNDHDARFVLGWDGQLYLCSDVSSSAGFVRYDRDGKVVMRHQLDRERDGTIDGEKFGVDAHGQILYVAYMNGAYALVRIAADGRQRVVVTTEVKRGGNLNTSDRILAVAPNGIAWMFGSYGRARVIGHDGQLLYISEKAKEEDDDDRRRAREKIENDEA